MAKLKIPSLNVAKRLGFQKAGKFKSKAKPKFTAKEFVDGMDDLGSELAHDFIEMVQQRLKSQPPDLKEIEEKYTNQPVPYETLSKSVKRDKAIAFVVHNVKAGNITTRDLFYMLEYGRKDEGVLPNPYLRKAFDDYRDTYEERINEELTGRRN